MRRRLTLQERIDTPRETPEQRRVRLVAHAAAMREAQAQQRATAHVCKKSETDTQLDRLKETLTRVAYGNVASTPIAMAEENNRWTVDITVLIPRVTGYAVEGTGDTLASALASARRALLDQDTLRARATRDATRYGYTF